MATFVPPFNPNNVVVGLGSMYWQAYSLTTPASLPAITQELGTTWASPWKPIGATDSGIELQFERSTNEIMIEESPTPIDEVTESLTVSFNVTLAEDTFDTMLLAYGGGEITNSAATSSNPGTRTFKLAAEAAFITVGFETMNPQGFWRRFLVPRCKSIADVAATYARQEDKRSFEISVKSLCPPSDVVIIEKTAVATG